MIEEFHIEKDEQGNEIKRSMGKFPHARIVPEFDSNKKYINRHDRPEWDMVGMLGKIYVRDDGTSKVGEYVKPINGIATASSERTKIRVMSRVNNHIIRVLLK